MDSTMTQVRLPRALTRRYDELAEGGQLITPCDEACIPLRPRGFHPEYGMVRLLSAEPCGSGRQCMLDDHAVGC